MDRIAEREFVDQLALMFERSGLAPVAGRILGRLLVCDPAHQSSSELADYLNASAGAVSTATRMLVQVGLVERIRFRSDRAMYFRIRPDAFGMIFQKEIEETRFMRQLGDRGLELLSDAPQEIRDRMIALRDLYALFEEALPPLWERWKARRS
jgi:DNA-binding transcriptional regulator GbsR (MarR family)